jgi:hypothetical protein
MSNGPSLPVQAEVMVFESLQIVLAKSRRTSIRSQVVPHAPNVLELPILPSTKCLIDHSFGVDIHNFLRLPSFDLLSHRVDVVLHAVRANRNAID